MCSAAAAAAASEDYGPPARTVWACLKNNVQDQKKTSLSWTLTSNLQQVAAG